jgi:hypothetical protein
MKKKEFFGSEEHGYVGNMFYDMFYETDFGELCCYLFYGKFGKDMIPDETIELFDYGTDVELKQVRLQGIEVEDTHERFTKALNELNGRVV